jgi:hypothetical protein
VSQFAGALFTTTEGRFIWFTKYRDLIQHLHNTAKFTWNQDFKVCKPGPTIWRLNKNKTLKRDQLWYTMLKQTGRIVEHSTQALICINVYTSRCHNVLRNLNKCALKIYIHEKFHCKTRSIFPNEMLAKYKGSNILLLRKW